jgi:hypothetical protein
MKLTSKQTLLSLLAGITIAVLFFLFLRPACWGPLVGVFMAAYLAKVSSPKEGASIGAIVLVPIGILSILQFPVDALSKDPMGRLGNIVGAILVLLTAPGIGAVYGLIIGKLFQMRKNKGIMF